MVGSRVRSLWVGSFVSVLAVGHLVAQRVATTTPDRAITESRRVTVDADHALLSAVLAAIGQQAGLVPSYNTEVLPPHARITLHVHDLAAADAFQLALRGTGLVAQLRPVTQSVIITRDLDAQRNGGIIGTVTDAKTKRPLVGASVALDGAPKGVLTDEHGAYRLGSVATGTHTLTVRFLGYTRRTQSVTIAQDQMATVDVALETSTNQLDQVVVTGTVAATALKAVPNAITVITGKQLEERGITQIDQLFHGDVPGLFALNQGTSGVVPGQVGMTSRGVTYLPGEPRLNTFANSTRTQLDQAIKTYVDGVELADPSFLGMIDPKSIERIEILTGPQASTIYGSGAINGVMQVFTKRGTTSRPELTVNLSSGLIQNNFSPALTPQHDYGARVSGVSGQIAYNVGGTWTYLGPWSPSVHTTSYSSFGGTRFEQGPMSIDVSVRRTAMNNKQTGAINQSQIHEGGTTTINPFPTISGPALAIFTTDGQTIGATLTYRATNWWSHTLTGGADETIIGQERPRAQYNSPADSTLLLNNTRETKTSFAYTTIMNVPLGAFATAVVTAGGDGWHSLIRTDNSTPTGLSGYLTTTSSYIFRQPTHNAGVFAQSQLGFSDNLFFTYGLRAEYNPALGKDANPNIVPRYGVAYTQNAGPVTAKFRLSYGHSTRPPVPGLTQGQLTCTYYDCTGTTGFNTLTRFGGDVYLLLPNPTLLPETQHGGEGGVELYLGQRASLVVTRYNQMVRDLILKTVVDSVRSFLPYASYGLTATPTRLASWPDGYAYQQQNEYVNIGNIRNEGWELQGSVNTGPLTTKGTYSWTKSRIIGLNPKYASAQSSYGISTGGSFNQLPEHTWALDFRYAHNGLTVSYDLQGHGAAYIPGFDEIKFLSVASRSVAVAPRYLLPDTYRTYDSGYALSDVNASQTLTGRLDATLQIQNLTNHYQNEIDVTTGSIGRQTMLGLRWRLE